MAKVKREKINENKPKKLKIILTTIIILIVIFALYSYFSHNNTTPKKTEPAKPAYLQSVSGDVQIYRNKSWSPLTKKQELFLSDKIKTLKGGEARIQLYGKADIYLTQNSQIELTSLNKNNLSIIQSYGISQNSFSKSNNYSYFVQTPNSTISVKGTQFIVNVLDREESVFVTGGEILIETDNNRILVGKYEKAQIDKNGEVQIIMPNENEIIPIIEQNKKTIQSSKQQRLSKIEENTMLLKIAEKTYGLTKEDIIAKLDAIDRGEIDDNLIIEKAPIKKDELREIKKINDKIKYSNAQIKYIEDKYNLSIK